MEVISKKKVNTSIAACFVSLPIQIIIMLEFVFMIFVFQGKWLNAVDPAVLAVLMKNRDFKSTDRDKTLKTGTVPAKTRHMVSLVIYKIIK